MSHELRTPLHGILSFAEFGIKDVEALSIEKNLGYYSRINQSANRLLLLINNLLDLSKLEAGKMNYEFNTVNVDTIIETSILEVQSLAEHKRVIINYQSKLEASNIICDQLRISQVLRSEDLIISAS